MYLGLLGCDWKTKWSVVAVQTGNLCRPGVGVEGSTVDKECMQIGHRSWVLVQTRLWAWQVEQAGSSLTDVHFPHRVLAGGGDRVERLSPRSQQWCFSTPVACGFGDNVLWDRP